VVLHCTVHEDSILLLLLFLALPSMHRAVVYIIALLHGRPVSTSYCSSTHSAITLFPGYPAHYTCCTAGYDIQLQCATGAYMLILCTITAVRFVVLYTVIKSLLNMRHMCTSCCCCYCQLDATALHIPAALSWLLKVPRHNCSRAVAPGDLSKHVGPAGTCIAVASRWQRYCSSSSSSSKVTIAALCSTFKVPTTSTDNNT
jgi:hypothetical protein